MRVLWPYESIEAWLSNDSGTFGISSQRAINYLVCNARLRRELARVERYAEEVKVSFDENDVESCEACLRFDGKVFAIHDIPELPSEKCTSDVGCKCHFREVFPEANIEEDAQLNILDHGATHGEDDEQEDAFVKLSSLKKMLDHDLITKEEYEAKKAELLSRM